MIAHRQTMLTGDQRRRFDRQARNTPKNRDSKCECKRCTEGQAAIIAALGGWNQTLRNPAFQAELLSVE